jgi:hypothetical protein
VLRDCGDSNLDKYHGRWQLLGQVLVDCLGRRVVAPQFMPLLWIEKTATNNRHQILHGAEFCADNTNFRGTSRCEDTRCEDTRCEDTRCEDTRCEDTRCEDTRCEDTRCEDTRIFRQTQAVKFRCILHVSRASTTCTHGHAFLHTYSWVGVRNPYRHCQVEELA